MTNCTIAVSTRGDSGRLANAFSTRGCDVPCLVEAGVTPYVNACAVSKGLFGHVAIIDNGFDNGKDNYNGR